MHFNRPPHRRGAEWYPAGSIAGPQGLQRETVSLISLPRHLFPSVMVEKFTQDYLWLSVATRHPWSPFTRVQRLSCCVTLLLCNMLINVMFWKANAAVAGREAPSTYTLHAGREAPSSEVPRGWAEGDGCGLWPSVHLLSPHPSLAIDLGRACPGLGASHLGRQ